MLLGYGEDIWRRRREIYDACRDSPDYYESLKRHAFLHGLAAAQVPLYLSSSRLCCPEVLRYAEVCRLDGFAG